MNAIIQFVNDNLVGIVPGGVVVSHGVWVTLAVIFGGKLIIRKVSEATNGRRTA